MYPPIEEQKKTSTES